MMQGYGPPSPRLLLIWGPFWGPFSFIPTDRPKSENAFDAKRTYKGGDGFMGFRINFKSDFSVHCYITVGQNTVVRQQHLSEFTLCTVRCRRIIVFNFDCRVHLFGQLSIFLS